MNKRKLLLVALALCMVAILAMGGTLAYLTDTDNAENVFTVGNVTIDLIEQQRKADEETGDPTDELEDFEQDKKLFPLVGNAQTDPDVAGLPTSENYVDKIVTVKNTGSEDAWIRVYFAIPSALDDGYDTFNAGLNILHFNYGTNAAGQNTNIANDAGNWWDWKTEAGNWNYYETTIDDIRYNVYFADYMKTTVENEVTERFLNGVYLDSSFDFNDAGVQTAFNNTFAVDESWDWNNVTCPVMAIAAQAAGFDTPDDAFDTSFGEQFNPWGGDIENWQE